MERHVDALARAGLPRVTNAGKPQRRRHARRELISQMTRRRTLAFFVVALAVEKTAGGVGDGVAAFVMTIRSVRPKGVNEMVTKRGIVFLRRSSVKPFLPDRRAAWLRRRDAPTRAVSRKFRGRWVLQIEHDAALVGVGVDESQTAFRMLDIAGEGRQQTVGIAARRLDLDYIGAQVGEQARR